MRVLFLDMDGVLNNRVSMLRVTQGVYPPDCTLRSHSVAPHCVRRLRWIVEELDLKIVISSVWRYVEGGADVARALAWAGWPDAPIIGITPPIHDDRRGVEIARWLAQHPEVTSYVILDDGIQGIHPFKRLVRCKFEYGLRTKDLAKIRRVFKRDKGKL